MGILANENAISSGGYNIANSLRFQSASSQYASRTPSGAGNRRTWTWSAWVKRGTLGGSQAMFTAGGSGDYGSTGTAIVINWDNDKLQFAAANTAPIRVNSAAVYRDPAAWYHVVIAFDTTQATASNRVKMYVNNSQITAFDATPTYPNQNTDWQVSNTVAHAMGTYASVLGNYFDGYMTEVNFIDGQALTPSSFGETNTLTGQWVAKKYTGTYGTNGFYLPFSNGTSTTTLGSDSSGNSNNWTLTNFTRSAGTSDCWMYDVPSGNGSAGTQPNSNYCVLNPLKRSQSTAALINGNLSFIGTSGSYVDSIYGTIGVTGSEKYYFEITGAYIVGVNNSDTNPTTNQSTGKIVYHGGIGQIFNGASAIQTGLATVNSSDVVGVALNLDAGTLAFYKNNVQIGTNVSISAASTWWPFIQNSTDYYSHINFGQRSFAYTPPSGFKALCTANLPASTIVKGNQYMDATLWTGNGSTQTITNAAGFSPDFVWIKNRARNDADPFYGVHMLFNTVTGVGNRLMSQSTAVEAFSSGSLTAFNSNGFSVGSDLPVNRSGDPFVAWQWDAGSSTVTNTNGTISSQVRANPTAGVSIVTWTPTASAGTIGHGLGVAPKMIVMKDRQNAYQWFVYHASIGAGKYLGLNTTTATTTNASVFSTTPTSSVFDPGTGLTTGNLYGNQVAYCFAEIAGFSKFGSYTGNGSTDGVFTFTGFTPKFIMTKRSDSTSAWVMIDTSRSSSNVATNRLYANESSAEDSADTAFDILSNGFKCRTTNTTTNASGGTYIYMAFASNPFSASNAR